MTTAEATRNPIYGILSGPSGGVAGALYVARKAGFENILTFDMGGTSTDVALCQNGEPTIGRETSISHFRIKVPSVNVHTVGAGRRLRRARPGADEGAPRRSRSRRAPTPARPPTRRAARSRPSPTRTSCSATCRRASSAARWSSTSEAARAAVQKVADAMGLASVEEAAEGILAIVNENMAGALRLVSVQRGHDPREFALVAYGGAGPLHANAVAEIMGSFPVLVPPAPGLLCAIGDLVADFRDEFAQTLHPRPLATPTRGRWPTSSRASASARETSSTARGSRATSTTSRTPPTCAITARATRSRSRSTRPTCAPTASPGSRSGSTGSTSSSTASACTTRRRRSSTSAPSAPARCRSPSCPWARPASADASAAVTDEHAIVFRGERVPTKLYDRAKLAPGMRFDGPAIVTEFDSTTVVLPGYAAEVDVELQHPHRPEGLRWRPRRHLPTS